MLCACLCANLLQTRSMVLKDQSNWNEDDSWGKFRNGNYSILGEIFEENFKELYFYGLKLVPVSDLVKDTIQDVFLDIWSRRTEMNTIENIKAYLFVSLRRKLLRHVTKLRKESTLDQSGDEPFVLTFEDFLVKKETDTKVTRALVKSLQQLTERQREVILLRFNHELEFQDMATIMDMNVQSVRNLLFRALEHIRKDMKSFGIEGNSDVEAFLLTIFQKRNLNFFQK